MRWREGRRDTATVGGLSAAFLVAIAASAGAHTFDQPDRALVATTGNDSELVKTIPISRVKRPGGTVVMSLPLETFGLASGDRLQLSSEVEVTTDCRFESPRCVGSPYTHNPKIKARLILAPTPTVARGAATTPVASLPSRRCRHIQHHCVFVFRDSTLDVSAQAPPACIVAGNCYANLVVAAFNRRARPGDKLIIGEDEPDGRIVQDKGRLNAVRLRPLVPEPEPSEPVTTVSTTERLADKVPIRDFLSQSKVVVFSQRLDELKANEQISVFARMTTNISDLPRDKQLVNSRLILAKKPQSRRPSELATRVAEHSELAEANGFNCSRARELCITKKVGVGRLLADASKRDGSPAPLYVNLVVGSTGGAHESDAGIAVTGGRLEVTRYPASRYG